MKYFGIVMTVVVLALLAPIARVNTGASRVSVANNSTEVVTMATEAEVPTTSTLTEEPTMMAEAATEVATESIGCGSGVDEYEDDYTSSEYIYANCVPGISDYSEYELDLLSYVMFNEAGCDWIPDEIPLMVGAVVLNRMNSPLYPDNMHDVIFEDGQYDTAYLFDKEPTPRVRALAQSLLENGFSVFDKYERIFPTNVLGQNGYGCEDGCGHALYDEYHDPELGTTIYFTYIYG